MQAKVSEEPESMPWSEPEDRQLKAPERQLLDAVGKGELDQHLVAIADAVHARRELLHTVRSARSQNKARRSQATPLTWSSSRPILAMGPSPTNPASRRWRGSAKPHC
jgi:hypothetical protein